MSGFRKNEVCSEVAAVPVRHSSEGCDPVLIPPSGKNWIPASAGLRRQAEKCSCIFGIPAIHGGQMPERTAKLARRASCGRSE
jgi:hypothetical protein